MKMCVKVLLLSSLAFGLSGCSCIFEDKGYIFELGSLKPLEGVKLIAHHENHEIELDEPTFTDRNGYYKARSNYDCNVDQLEARLMGYEATFFNVTYNVKDTIYLKKVP